jgi:hypothetical protein
MADQYILQVLSLSCMELIHKLRLFIRKFYLWLYSSLLGLGRFFTFLILYTVSRTPWTGDQPVARQLPEHRTAQTQHERTQSFMPQVRFEPTIQVFDGAKTVHALDRAATVIGIRKL